MTSARERKNIQYIIIINSVLFWSEFLYNKIVCPVAARRRIYCLRAKGEDIGNKKELRRSIKSCRSDGLTVRRQKARPDCNVHPHYTPPYMYLGRVLIKPRDIGAAAVSALSLQGARVIPIATPSQFAVARSRTSRNGDSN